MQNKQRHGCLTAWLIYLIIAYSFSAIFYFFKPNEISNITSYKTSENMMLIYGSVAIFGVIFSIMLFKWMKLGFWGILTISVILFTAHIINDGNQILSPLFVFFCLIIIYALLQLKKGKISGWKNLE